MKTKFESYSRLVTWFITLLLVALAAGCGGGGGGGRDPILGSGAGSGLGLPNVVSIAVRPAAPSILITRTQQFTATATFSDESSRDVTADPGTVWHSATLGVATFVAPPVVTGIATGVAAGTSDITATFGGVTSPAGAAILTVIGGGGVAAGTCTAGPLPLGRATTFGVLAGTALTITNPTSITGDVGSPSITPAVGPSTLVAGTLFDSSPATDLTVIANAVTDMQTAIACATARPCDFNYAVATDFATVAGLAPGHHCVAAAMSVGSNLTLSTPGVYIFDATGALTTPATIVLQFGGTANAANTSVFWVSSGAASGASIGATNTFLGTIMVDPGAATLGANTTLLGGHVLSGSAVTLDTNTITIP